MSANAVPGFLPSVHGLRFANAFPPGPTVRLGPLDTRFLGFGNAAAGLCGGMALTARDLFEAGLTAPPDHDPPANGAPRFRALVRRQVESLDWLRVPLRYLDLQALRPDPPRGLATLLRREPPRVPAVLEEWPRIRRDIDAGRPPVVGLVRWSGLDPWALTRNHQVLAFAYEAEQGSITIRVYDPNHPGRDDVELRVSIDPEDPADSADPADPAAAAAAADPRRPWRDRIRLAQSTGEPLLGFFRQPYPPPRSVRAWRPT